MTSSFLKIFDPSNSLIHELVIHSFDFDLIGFPIQFTLINHDYL